MNNNKRRIVDIFKNRKVFGTALGIIFYLFCIFFFTYAFYSWRSEETEVVIGINDSQAEIVFENNGLVNAENIGPVLSYFDGANGGFTATNELNRTIEINIRLRILSISDNLVNEDFKYVLLKSEDGGTNYDVEVASGDFTSLQVGMNLLAIDTIPAGAIYAYKLYVYIDGSVKNNNEMQSNSMMSVLSIRDYTELSEMAAGSYVAYTGNNGCKGKSCKGQNANYVSDTDMGYCSDSNSKFTVNGWRVAYTKGGAAYIVSAGAPECVGQVYAESKSTSTLNYYDTLTYLVSDTAAYDSDTSSYVLGTTTTYSLPDDISSLDNKYTCGDETTTSCANLYKIVVDSNTNIVQLEQITTSTCTSSTSSTASNYKSCQMNYKYVSNTSTINTHYYGTDYIVVDDGFQLSGTISSTTTYLTSKYTCRSSDSSAICDTLYYVTGNGHSVTGTNTAYTYYYASYKKYTFDDYYKTDIFNDYNYLYGSDYEFDLINGGYTLKDTSTLNWKNDYQSIINTNKYTCLSDSNNCDTMYEITSDSTSSQTVYYTYNTVDDVTADTFITTLQEQSKKYCNTQYAYLGKCDENSVWPMNGDDFSSITTNTLSSCGGIANAACGGDNGVINNGGIYWYGTKYGTSYAFYFNGRVSADRIDASFLSFGLRPVIRLDSQVVVTGGSGTYEDPYIIEKYERMYLSEVEAGSYVAYTGNNGCEGAACNGQNANYVSDTNMGYCSDSSSKFTVNGWRVAYIADDSAYIVSAGAPECINSDYSDSKNSSSNLFYGGVTFVVSDSATYDSDTSSYVLGTTTSYNMLTDASLLDGKYTCGISGDTSCSVVKRLDVDNESKLVSLRGITSTTCTRSGYTCQIFSYTGSAINKTHYYGTSYIVTDGGFKLSGVEAISDQKLYSGDIDVSGYYTCGSTVSDAVCNNLYYLSGSNILRTTGSQIIFYSSNRKYVIETSYSAYKYCDNKTCIFGSDYVFDVKTGTYILNNTSVLSSSDDYNTFFTTKKYSCLSNSNSCSTMYEFDSEVSNNGVGYYYSHTPNRVGNDFIKQLNKYAERYCNPGYSYLGKCDENSVWAMNDNDFSKITTSTLSSCNGSTTTACGNDNNLIKNGGIYWYGTEYSSSYIYSFNSTVLRNQSLSKINGIRPVVRLDPYTLVTGGSGTYEDPYKIGFIEPEETETTEET